MKTAQKANKKAAQEPQEASGVRIHCSYTDLRPTAALRPNPGNPNGHPEAQVEKLAKVIAAHGWRHPITVSRRSGLVVSGHCRLLAAQKLGLAEVPVDEQDFASEAEEMAVLIADNVVQELAEVDGLKMAELLCELDQADYDLSLTALSKEQIDDYIIGPTATDMPTLPNGDKAPFQQMTFTLHDSQAEIVQAAIKAALAAGPFVDSPNENSNGNALARIAEAYCGQG